MSSISQKRQILRATFLEFIEKIVVILEPDEISEDKTPISFQGIIDETARYFGMKPVLLLSRNQVPEVVSARHMAMFVVKDLLHWTGSQTARAFGVDHTTVRSACQKIDSVLKNPADPRYGGVKKAVETIRERVLRG